VDVAAVVALARLAHEHRWTWTRAGLDDAAAALGLRVGARHGSRVDLEGADPLGPAYAMFLDDELVEVACELLDPIEVDPGDEDAAEDAETATFEAWDQARRAIADALGAPAFADGRANPRFPADEEFADWLARWPLEGGGHLALKVLHEDSGLPYRVSLVAEQPAEG
jgi:hypothetical protein